MTIREMHQQMEKERWEKIIRECRSSGQTVVSWCEERNLSTKTYYRWEKRVVQEGAIKKEDMKLPVPQPTTFVEIPHIQQLNLERTDTKTRRNVAATVKWGEAEIDIYEGADTEIIATLWRIISHAE